MTTNEWTERNVAPGDREPEPSQSGPDDSGDADLCESFSALRAADASLAPDFDTLMARPLPIRVARPRRISAAALRLGLPLAAAAALVLLFTRPGRDDAFTQAVLAYTVSPALGAWSSPTGSLMRTPGNELLKRAPEIGRVTPWPATPDVRRAFRDTTHGG